VLAATDKSVLFVRLSKNGSVTLNSEAAVVCVASRASTFIEVSSGSLLSSDSCVVSGARDPPRMLDPERTRV